MCERLKVTVKDDDLILIWQSSSNVQMPSGGVRAPLSESELKEKYGFAYEAPEDNETDGQRHNRLRRMRHRARHTAAHGGTRRIQSCAAQGAVQLYNRTSPCRHY
jgi:hypothetical protein